jgi:hypothetical protein
MTPVPYDLKVPSREEDLEGIILYDLLEMIFVPVNFAAMEMLKNRM